MPEESLFGVSIRLTEEGVPAWDSVVGLVFHLLHLVRASDVGVRRRLWWEVQTTTALNFKYRPKDREDVQSENMAFALHHYPPEEVLGASELIYEELDEANNNKVDTLLDKTLVPSNMRLHLACPAAEVPAFFGGAVQRGFQEGVGEGVEEAAPGETAAATTAAAPAAKSGTEGAGEAGEGGLEDDGWQSDKWFGTQFRVRAFSADLLARWSNWYTCLATDACVYTTRPHAHARPPARTHVHTCTHRYKCLAADACECVEGPGRKAIVDRLDLPPANRYIRGACALLPAPEAPSLEPTLVLDTPTMQGVMHEGALGGCMYACMHARVWLCVCVCVCARARARARVRVRVCFRETARERVGIEAWVC